MRDIDPQLAWLREIECRIATVQDHLREHEQLLERMRSRGLDLALAEEQRQIFVDALGLFRRRQDQILAGLRQTNSVGPVVNRGTLGP